MAKLDQKFSKGSKFKHKFDEDFHDFEQPSKKKKRRIARQREEFPGYEDDNHWGE